MAKSRGLQVEFGVSRVWMEASPTTAYVLFGSCVPVPPGNVRWAHPR